MALDSGVDDQLGAGPETRRGRSGRAARRTATRADGDTGLERSRVAHVDLAGGADVDAFEEAVGADEGETARELKR